MSVVEPFLLALNCPTLPRLSAERRPPSAPPGTEVFALRLFLWSSAESMNTCGLVELCAAAL